MVDSRKEMVESSLPAILLSIAVLATIYALDRRYVPKHEASEPPIVRSFIPYIGHILGLIRHGISYYQLLRYVVDHPSRCFFSHQRTFL